MKKPDFGTVVTIDGVTWTWKFAWLPKKCEAKVVSDGFSESLEYHYVWWSFYWSAHVLTLSKPRYATPGLLAERLLLSLTKKAAQPFGAAMSKYASSASVMATSTQYSLDEGLEKAVRIIAEESARKVMTEMLDELFRVLPADTVPQERIDELYEKMGYGKEKEK